MLCCIDFLGDKIIPLTNRGSIINISPYNSLQVDVYICYQPRKILLFFINLIIQIEHLLM
jgi:hypothetical protein